MYDHIGAFVLILAAVLLLAAGVMTHLRQEREIQDAKRRHPSARPAMPDLTSDAARRYHESNQWGR